MKQTKSIRNAILVCVGAMMSVCLAACGSDDPDPVDTDPKDNGDVTFAIDIPQGAGNGTYAQPVAVGKGEKLDIEISQTSSYTDPDGTVFTCEPKATISLHATLDTVVAKDLAALTKVKDGSDIRNSSAGTYPVRRQTVQTFDVGGQNIVFDLGHEIYTYTNSLSQKIEMPYVKAGEAKLGNAAATEETPQGRSAVAVSSVTVRPLATTRATEVVDSTMYEVTVRFNLDILSVNAKKDVSRTLEFAVTYVGVVETTTTLLDRVTELSYRWQTSGSATTASPFVRQPGRTMQLQMLQTSSLTDEYGNKSTATPKATVTVSVANDTVWTTSSENLKKLPDISGNLPEAQSATQRFGGDGQTVTINWNYESAGELPYYALEPAALKSVETKELGEKTVGGKEASLYEVTATFTQKATPKNAAKDAETVEVEYVVSYIGAVEITLTGVSYEPYGEWIDSHDNLALAYYAKVKRIRRYSNGREYEDIFSDYGHSAAVYASEVSGPGSEIFGLEGEFTITTYPSTLSNRTDSTITCSWKTELPKMAEFRVGEMSDFPRGEYTLGNVSTYIKSRNAEHPDLPVRFESDYPADSRPSGWYYKGFSYSHTKRLYWMLECPNCSGGYEKYLVATAACTFDNHDQCLVIDGICIDFKKLHNYNFDWKVDYTDFNEDWGEGTVATMTTTLDYLGKRFVATQIDSLYVAR